MFTPPLSKRSKNIRTSGHKKKDTLISYSTKSTHSTSRILKKSIKIGPFYFRAKLALNGCKVIYLFYIHNFFAKKITPMRIMLYDSCLYHIILLDLRQIRQDLWKYRLFMAKSLLTATLPIGRKRPGNWFPIFFRRLIPQSYPLADGVSLLW